MDILLSIITLIGAILNIILFFKIWGMTNNVSEILDIMRTQNFKSAPIPNQPQPKQPDLNKESGDKPSVEEVKFNVGDTVSYYKKELKIVADNGDGTYACVTPDGRPYSNSIEWKKLRRIQ